MAAAATLKPFKGPTSGVSSDGSRWAAWQEGPAAVIASDERRETLRRIAVPADCTHANVNAAGSARIAVGCFDTLEEIVLSARNGSVLSRYSLGGIEVDGAESVQVIAIGERRLTTVRSGYHWHRTYVADWRTAGIGQPEDALGEANVPALDGPVFGRPLCAPLHRRVVVVDSYENDDAYRSYQYEPPWGLTRDDGGRVVLERCGRAGAAVLCSACGSEQLGGGYVTWVAGDHVTALRLRDRRRFVYRAPGMLSATHSARRLFVRSTHEGPTGLPIFKTFVAKLAR
jgi:hypothetical protein